MGCLPKASRGFDQAGCCFPRGPWSDRLFQVSSQGSDYLGWLPTATNETVSVLNGYKEVDNIP
jgi:hypothetical protein